MNRQVFATQPGHLVAKTDTTNEAGGKAYSMGPKEALVQLAVTSCFNNTYYVGAESQAEKVLELCGQVDAGFVARVAVYARQRGHMKDAPAVLLASLASRDVGLFARTFSAAADDANMAKRVAHIIRSGVTGRKSFGTAIRRVFRNWLDSLTDDQVFRGSVGGDVTMADLIRMIHPMPQTRSRQALYAYLIGKEPCKTELPPLVLQFEAFKRGETKEVPKVPFMMLTGLSLGDDAWKEIAKTASWVTTRMNLNTFARHNVFRDEEMIGLVCKRLRDPEQIAKAKAFPYQLLTTFKAAAAQNQRIGLALQDAMEIATANVPVVGGRVVVCVDVSGSMSSPVTGNRDGSTTATACVDVAALIASVLLRANPEGTTIIPFNDRAYWLSPPMNPRDSIMTNARGLANLCGGGTACGAPMAAMNQENRKADLIIYISDNESWADGGNNYPNGFTSALMMRGTGLSQEWAKFKSRCPSAKMVCIDLQPNTSRQAEDRLDTLNVGGFGDVVFDVVADFASGRASGGVGLVHEIGQIEV